MVENSAAELLSLPIWPQAKESMVERVVVELHNITK